MSSGLGDHHVEESKIQMGNLLPQATPHSPRLLEMLLSSEPEELQSEGLDYEQRELWSRAKLTIIAHDENIKGQGTDGIQFPILE